MTRTITLAAAAALTVAAGAAGAEEHVVQMLNQGPDGNRMVFEPAVIDAEPGDTVRFVPTNKGHNAMTVDRALPDEVEGFRGGINNEVVWEVPQEGLFLVQCQPHYALGMIALIASGDDLSNVEQVQDVRLPGKAAQRFEDYLAEAREAAEG